MGVRVMDEEGIRTGLRELVRADPAMRPLADDWGPKLPAHGGAGSSLDSLMDVVLSQQLSIKAAATIEGRVREACGGSAEAAALLRLGEGGLRACGVSGAKVRCILALAEAEQGGRLRFAELAGAPDEHIERELLPYPGVGPWTLDNFLIFGLGRIDRWPAADIGLQDAVALLRGWEGRPSAERIQQEAELWRPFRSLAARLLWAWRDAQKRQLPKQI